MLWRVVAGAAAVAALSFSAVVGVGAAIGGDRDEVLPAVIHSFRGLVAGPGYWGGDPSGDIVPRVNVHSYAAEDFELELRGYFDRYRPRLGSVPMCGGGDDCEYVLDLLDGSGVLLGSVSLSVAVTASLFNFDGRSFLANEFFTEVYDPPVYAGFAIRRVDSGVSVVVERSAHVPFGGVSGVGEGAVFGVGDPVRLRLSLGDLDGDDLNYQLFVARNGGKYSFFDKYWHAYRGGEWNIVPAGVGSVEVVVPRSVLGAESGSARVGFSVSDGTRSVLVESPEFWLDEVPPSVRVSEPEDSQVFVVGAGGELGFRAHGEELGELVFEDWPVWWFSSRDGFLGSGPVLVAGELSVGEHELWVVQQDASGRWAADSVRVAVRPPAQAAQGRPPDIGAAGSIDIVEGVLFSDRDDREALADRTAITAPAVREDDYRYDEGVDEGRAPEVVVHSLPAARFDLGGLVLPAYRYARAEGRHECAFGGHACWYGALLLDAGGVGVGHVHLRFDSLWPGPERRFAGVVVGPPEYASLAFEDGHGRRVVAPAPGGRVSAEVAGIAQGQVFAAGEPVGFGLSADAQDNGELSYKVFFSSDGGGSYGRYWQQYASGNIPEGSGSVTVEVPGFGLPATQTARLGISVAGAGGSVFVESPIFEIAEHDPEVIIAGARHDRVYATDSDETIELKAMGYDFGEDWLDETAFEWHSDLDGRLGEGRELQLQPRQLTHGTHTITVTVTNRQNQQATDTIKTTITPPLNQGLDLGKPLRNLRRSICEQITSYC